VDVEMTLAEPIRDMVDTEIRLGKLAYAWVYGRLLYDRFFDMFPHRLHELSHDETRRLLEGTPTGVFQVRDLVAGPLGLVRSSCQRLLPPMRRVYLWHCSDPSCPAFHPVLLASGESDVNSALEYLRRLTLTREETCSDWYGYFKRLDEPEGYYYDDTRTDCLPLLLGDALSLTDARSLVTQLLSDYPEGLRHRLQATEGSARRFGGSPESIAQQLDEAECLQVMLLMSDEAVIRTLEFLVDTRAIRLPPTEMRAPVLARSERGSWGELVCVLSRCGVRSAASEDVLNLARLKLLVNTLYPERPELEWKLRHVEGESVHERLDAYVRVENPRDVIRTLVLDSPKRLEHACQILRHGFFPSPRSPAAEESLIDRILWKLGFHVPMYPPHQAVFWERVNGLRHAAKEQALIAEREREIIRGAAVNLFVSLEEVLDHTLSFSAWALLSDHYGVTNFRYRLEDARRLLASRLSGRRTGPAAPLDFDPHGKNPLYHLVSGLAILADVCNEVIKDGGEMQRPENELPGYCGKTPLFDFPFLHKALVLDLRPTDREQIMQQLEQATTALERANVCSVRNRIEHRRQEFPTADEIATACGAVADIISSLERSGLCPLVYLYVGRKVDEYGRGIAQLRNYRGEEALIPLPVEHIGCGLPDLSGPQVVVPSMHVGDSLDIMRFRFEETSDYAERWRDYPRRRTRPSHLAQDQPATTEPILDMRDPLAPEHPLSSDTDVQKE
jgi:hypothetical protein